MSTIEIKTFNPYENRFPNRKLVSWETLVLIKLLKIQGINVIVLPDNDQPIEYLYRKGLKELLSDPVYAFLINIPTSLIISLFANYLSRLTEKKEVNSITINVENFIIKNKIDNKSYLIDGSEIASLKEKIAQKNFKKRQSDFERCFNSLSPYPQYPIPIFEEHKPKVIGWCILWEDENGLKTEGKIIDKIIRKKMDKGKLSGASVTGIAKTSICSICKSDYINCNHIAGDFYNGIKCNNRIVQADFIEVSLVKRPINKSCIIGLQ